MFFILINLGWWSDRQSYESAFGKACTTYRQFNTRGDKFIDNLKLQSEK